MPASPVAPFSAAESTERLSDLKAIAGHGVATPMGRNNASGLTSTQKRVGFAAEKKPSVTDSGNKSAFAKRMNDRAQVNVYQQDSDSSEGRPVPISPKVDLEAIKADLRKNLQVDEKRPKNSVIKLPAQVKPNLDLLRKFA